MVNKKYEFIRKLIVLILFTSGLSSCNDEFLERQPLNLISEATVWEDVILVELYVNEIYALMRTGLDHNPRLTVLSDEANARGRDLTHTVVQGGLNSLNAETQYAINYWAHYYDIINRANVFLTKVEEETLPSIEEQEQGRVQRLIGEVKFFRAYAYFRLTAFYGGVPLITKAFELDDDFNVPRASYNEIIDFVIIELDGAIELLPLEYSSSELGRITQGAAMAIKGRALLYAASPLNNPTGDRDEWKKAADAAKDLIDLGIYSLHPEYKEVFLERFNQEQIWIYAFNNGIQNRTQLELNYYPNGSGGYGQVHPLHGIVEAFETINGMLPSEDPSFNPNNPYVDRDPRFYDMILYDGAPWQDREIETFRPGGADSEDGNEGWNATWTGYYPRKFIDESITRPSSTNISDPQWIYSRYGEILLNYAESMFYLGEEDVAREYLNIVRSRPSVNMPPVTDSGESLERRIQNERRIELYMEEHRWFDVRRWKIADITENKPAERVSISKNMLTGEKTYKIEVFEDRKFLERNYLVPIPQTEIDKNPFLTQNPGY